MSTPITKLYSDRNRNPDGSYTCCEGRTPKPLWQLVATFPSMAEPIRNLMVQQQGEVAADEPYCPACHTILEQLRDGVIQGGPAFVSLIATVVSFVPGIGQAVSGVLTGAMALAQGQDINDAFVSGLKGSLPGGAIAQVAFDVGQAALQGKPLDQIGIAALPIPAGAKNLVSSGLGLAKSIARGEHISEIAIDQVYNQLPESSRKVIDAASIAGMGPNQVAQLVFEESQKSLSPDDRKALLVGMAVGQAQVIQGKVPMTNSISLPVVQTRAAVRVDPASRVALVNAGQKLAETDPVIAARRLDQRDGPNRRGFDMGMGTASGAKTMAVDSTGKVLNYYVSWEKFPASVSNTFSGPDLAETLDGFNNGLLFYEIWRKRTKPVDAATRVAMAKAGDDFTKASPTISAARNVMLNPNQVRGFNIATGLVLAKPEIIHASDSDIQWVRNGMDPDTQLGFDQGIAHARIRLGVAVDPHTRVSFAQTGFALAKSDPITQAARSVLPDGEARRGFDIATGLLQGAPSDIDVNPVRNTLNVETRSGFDMGLALRDGRLSGISVPEDVATASDKAAFLAAAGLVGKPESMKVATLTTLAQNPATRSGAEKGVEQITQSKKGIFQLILEFFGLG